MSIQRSDFEEHREALRELRWQRQEEVLKAVIRHGSNKAAAAALGIGQQHVKNTLTDLYKRLGISGLPSAAYALWLRDLWREDEETDPVPALADPGSGYAAGDDGGSSGGV